MMSIIGQSFKAQQEKFTHQDAVRNIKKNLGLEVKVEQLQSNREDKVRNTLHGENWYLLDLDCLDSNSDLPQGKLEILPLDYIYHPPAKLRINPIYIQNLDQIAAYLGEQEEQARITLKTSWRLGLFAFSFFVLVLIGSFIFSIWPFADFEIFAFFPLVVFSYFVFIITYFLIDRIQYKRLVFYNKHFRNTL